MTEQPNPLMAATRSRSLVSKWSSLEEYCDWANSFHWVRESGKPYFIRTLDDGTMSLDRKA
jgi:hypothetical protein